MRFLVIVLAISSCGLKAQEIQKLNWLVGTWERENVRPGRTAFETWKWDGQALAGIGVTLQGSDTVFVERLSIVEKDGQLNYVANVSSNGAPTFFKITSFSETDLVSENPEHDFPKKIVYKLSDDKMIATISGDGKEIPFAFKKTD